MQSERGAGGEPGQGDGGTNTIVDWSVAAATAARFVGSGPSVPREVADDAVAKLNRFAREAEEHVRALTGLANGLPIPDAAVMDRRTWVARAAGGLDALTSRAIAQAVGERRDSVGRLFASSAGVQTGLALAFLGSKVLGQYEPFGDAGGTDPLSGRLMLVAPNIVAAERAMQVPADEFRMWVCLHECTHRVQFIGVDWLGDYFADEVGRFISGMDESAAIALSNLPAVIREARKGPLGIIEALQSPAQRQAFDRLIALSTLLEGHADYVMDAVGPEVVPSVAAIRRKFTERRKGGGLLDRILRSLLGVDAKIQQYEQGGKFTREIVAEAGMAGFNAVWRSPNTLPTRAEIAEPRTWLTRVTP